MLAQKAKAAAEAQSTSSGAPTSQVSTLADNNQEEDMEMESLPPKPIEPPKIQLEAPSQKHAAMPGQWQVVQDDEEEEEYNQYRKAASPGMS